MSALPIQTPRMTEEEYLAYDRESDDKYEFIDGEIYAVSGASATHNSIVADILGTLFSQLRQRECSRFASDMKVWIPTMASYFYPDVSIVCGTAEFHEERQDILLNPTLIFEMLSPSTASFDKGDKFDRYRELSSLQEYVLIAQDKPRIERYLRLNDGTWEYVVSTELDASITLKSIGCQLALADVYAQVTFDNTQSAPASDDQEPANSQDT